MKEHGPIEDLFRAVKAGKAGRVRKMIEAGADIHATDEHGASLLHYAACGMPEMVRLLCEQGAEFHVRDARGYAPLHVAFLRKDVAIVRLLTGMGADAHAPIPGMRSPVEEARAAGDTDMLEALGVQAAFVG